MLHVHYILSCEENIVKSEMIWEFFYSNVDMRMIILCSPNILIYLDDSTS